MHRSLRGRNRGALPKSVSIIRRSADVLVFDPVRCGTLGSRRAMALISGPILRTLPSGTASAITGNGVGPGHQLRLASLAIVGGILRGPLRSSRVGNADTVAYYLEAKYKITPQVLRAALEPAILRRCDDGLHGITHGAMILADRFRRRLSLHRAHPAKVGVQFSKGDIRPRK